MPLHVRVDYREQAFDVSAIARVECALESFYVRLRHAPNRLPGRCTRVKPASRFRRRRQAGSA